MRELVKRMRAVARASARRAVGWREHGRVAYSQEGEDLVIAKLLGMEGRCDTAGLYIDIGAHHPFRYSNTYYFYQRGWHGINIDAAHGMKHQFDRARPRDINVECAIAGERREIEFVEFNEPALSGADPALAASRDGRNGHYITRRRIISAVPLREVLTEYLRGSQAIDFLSIDIEGMDVEALGSNDWSRWRPKLIIVEETSVVSVEEIGVSEIGRLMAAVGYMSIAKLGLSLIFADRSRVCHTELGVRVR